MSDVRKINRALLSTTDKTGLVDLAKKLREYGTELISTGGTYKKLTEGGIEVMKVEDYTKFPEMLDGRVKTLHPSIHAGILAKREPKHLNQLREHNIPTIDMVVSNLYRFEDAVAKGLDYEEIVENIDIGGPSMIRSAAKNHKYVAVVVDPARYEVIMDELDVYEGGLSWETRKDLATDAFVRTAQYDGAIGNWFEKQRSDGLPKNLFLALKQAKSLYPDSNDALELRYGENPVQKAVAWEPIGYLNGVLHWKQVGGPTPSFNRINEAARVNCLLAGFKNPTVYTGKHGMGSGAGSSIDGVEEAYVFAHGCDREADLGNQTFMNRECTVKSAKMIGKDAYFREKNGKMLRYEKNRYGEDLKDILGITDNFNKSVKTDGMGAPSFEEGAPDILNEKQKTKMCVFQTGSYSNFPFDIRYVDGMFLGQDPQNWMEEIPRVGEWVTKKKGNEEIEAIGYAGFEVARRHPSNSAALVDGKVEDGEAVKWWTLGIGTSTKRNRANWMAIENAKYYGNETKSTILANDGFLPEELIIKYIANAEIYYIFVPKGGYRFEKVVQAANDHGIGVYCLPPEIRLFSH